MQISQTLTKYVRDMRWISFPDWITLYIYMRDAVRACLHFEIGPSGRRQTHRPCMQGAADWRDGARGTTWEVFELKCIM